MRMYLIAANWKMNKTTGEVDEFIEGLERHIEAEFECGKDVVLIPPFTAIDYTRAKMIDLDLLDIISLGAQNVYWEESGAFTGEVSAEMLADIGCEYVVIGHSERREYFGETDETVNKKLAASFKQGLKPILCVGEREAERKSEKTIDVIEKQLKGALSGFDADDLSDLVIAYEPVWAIGTGLTATPAQAQEVHKFIRNFIADEFGSGLAEKIRVIYGGSVKPENVKSLMSEEDIDGALVGGASLKADSFFELISFDK